MWAGWEGRVVGEPDQGEERAWRVCRKEVAGITEEEAQSAWCVLPGSLAVLSWYSGIVIIYKTTLLQVGTSLKVSFSGPYA